MIEIDASRGEGGGQMLRSALSLSVITGQAIRLTGVRARRPEPGLKPQHLKAVEAAACISGAAVEGARLGSQALVFVPGALRSGKYDFDIGTAGSVSLLLQTLSLPLSFADGPSGLTLRGGTHVPWSPCFHYLQWQWLPRLDKAGYHVACRLERAGFYPRGGGIVHAAITPCRPRKPLRLSRRGRLLRVRGLSGVGRLDRTIAERQRRRAIERLRDLQVPLEIELAEVESVSPGTFLVLQAEFEGGRCCASALGARHKPAERVADEAAAALRADIDSGGAVDAWLADQLLLPLAFVPGRSELAVSRVSQHLLSNAELLGHFLPATIEIEGEPGAPGSVRIEGVPAETASKAPVSLGASDTPLSAGVVVVRRGTGGWRMLVLRAYRNWDFPKGRVEPGEDPLEAAMRETAEEAAILDLAFRWGEGYCETEPYGRGKVARYYLAETAQAAVELPVSPELGRPEHHAWRWVSPDEAERLLPPRLQPVLAWARRQLGAA